MTRTKRIVPAILTDDPEALKTMLNQAEGFTDYVQIDIMDGQFVPSRSITCQHLLGLQTKLHWEAHLMVEAPETHLEGFRKAGSQRVVFHYEATPSPLSVISLARELGLEVGLAVNPETEVSALESLLDKVDSVLLLTVTPGFYGSPFIPEVLDKVPELRRIRPELEIGVDGGVKRDNVAQIAKRGVDMLCVGSAVFLQPQPSQAYQSLVELLQSIPDED
jgi:ribulose-phosphate 3-epimerase